MGDSFGQQIGCPLLAEGGVPQTEQEGDPTDEESPDYHQEIRQLGADYEVVPDTVVSKISATAIRT